MESWVCGPKASFLGSVLVWRGCPTCWPTPPQGGACMEEGRHLAMFASCHCGFSSTHSMTLLGTFAVVLRYSIGPYFHINSLLLYFKDVKFLGYFNLFAGTVRDPASLLLLTFSHGDPDQFAFLLPSLNFFLGLPTHYFQASQSP